MQPTAAPPAVRMNSHSEPSYHNDFSASASSAYSTSMAHIVHQTPSHHTNGTSFYRSVYDLDAPHMSHHDLGVDSLGSEVGMMSMDSIPIDDQLLMENPDTVADMFDI